jgi:parvulin-like peptidyl-prolyl isomerase
MALEQEKSTMKKQGLFTNVILGLTLGAMVFFGMCNPQSSAPLSGNAASVAGEEITRYDFQREYDKQSNQVRQSQRAKNNPAESRLATRSLESLIQSRIMFLESKKAGFLVDKESVVENLLEQQAFQDNGVFKEEYFKRYLRYSQYTEETFFKFQQRELSASQFQSFLFDFVHFSDSLLELRGKMAEVKVAASFIKISSKDVDFKISSQQVEEFLKNPASSKRLADWYNNNITNYQSAAKVKASHILVSYKGAQKALAKTKRTKTQAQKEALAIYKKVSKNNFSKIALSNSDDASVKQNKGDLGLFEAEAMTPEFSKKAFSMKVGQISKPVETPFGFHIILLQDKQVAKNTSLEQAKDSIVKTLISQTEKLKVSRKIAADILLSLGKKQNIDSQLKKHNLKWQSTGDFSPLSYSIPKLGDSGDFLSALSSLQGAGKVYSEPLLHAKDYYVLRLDKITKGEGKDIENLKNRLLWEEKYKISLSLSSQLYKQYQDLNLIELNQSYLALDNPVDVKK